MALNSMAGDRTIYNGFIFTTINLEKFQGMLDFVLTGMWKSSIFSKRKKLKSFLSCWFKNKIKVTKLRSKYEEFITSESIFLSETHILSQ